MGFAHSLLLGYLEGDQGVVRKAAGGSPEESPFLHTTAKYSVEAY